MGTAARNLPVLSNFSSTLAPSGLVLAKPYAAQLWKRILGASLAEFSGGFYAHVLQKLSLIGLALRVGTPSSTSFVEPRLMLYYQR
jgi:hypothetical protein